MNYGLQEKVALVTGASGNLGRAVCVALAESGASVVLLCRSAASERQIGVFARQLSSEHRVRTVVMQGDVNDESSMSIAIHTAIDRLGSLDIVVNNAGVFTVGEQDLLCESDWDLVMGYECEGTLAHMPVVDSFFEAIKGDRGEYLQYQCLPSGLWRHRAL